MELTEVENHKCIVCGYKKIGVERNDLPLCGWCNNPKFLNLLAATTRETDEAVQKANFIDTTNDPLFSFIADLGMLGSEHPFMASLRQVLGEVIRQVSGKGITDVETYAGKDTINMEDLYGAVRFRYMPRFLGLLRELNLIEFETEEVDGRNILRRVKIPEGSLIQKIAATAESASGMEDPKLTRASAFTLGYITLKSIEKTLEILHQKGKLHYGQALTKFYPIDKNNRIMVVKGYTAPIAFIFGWWASKGIQFTEYDLQRFLGNRGLMGRQFRRVVNWLGGGHPSSVQVLYKFETITMNGVPVLRFTLNPNYDALRERILERERERERERGEVT